MSRIYSHYQKKDPYLRNLFDLLGPYSLFVSVVPISIFHFWVNSPVESQNLIFTPGGKGRGGPIFHVQINFRGDLGFWDGTFNTSFFHENTNADLPL